MVALALAGLAALFAIMAALAAYLMMSQRQGAKAEEPQEEEEATVVGGGRRRPGSSRMQGANRRRTAAAAARAAQAGPSHADSDSEDEDDDEGEEHLTKKEAKRREREAQREAERAAREAKANKVSAYEERRRRKDEEREALEQAQEEEMRRAAEERQRREDAEAAKWMGMISVEGEGQEEVTEAQSAEALLNRFVAYIQERKMVPLEEIAVEFHLRSAEVVDRIQNLEAMGRLTGVMDERGKYIYISAEEMQAVARYVQTKGRVAIGELAARSDDLIDLEGKAAAAGAGDAGLVVDFDSMLLGGEVDPVGA